MLTAFLARASSTTIDAGARRLRLCLCCLLPVLTRLWLKRPFDPTRAVRALAHASGVGFCFRPVLPMLMRGLAVPRKKSPSPTASAPMNTTTAASVANGGPATLRPRDEAASAHARGIARA